METRQSINDPEFRELILEQAGYFSLAQAREFGLAPQLIIYHHDTGRFERALRGVYRDTWHPEVETGEFLALWLWADGLATFSHETALWFHELSDASPTTITMTAPQGHSVLRRKHPVPGLKFVGAQLESHERVWRKEVPITGVRRTLSDCIEASVSPDLIGQAVEEAYERDLISERERIECYIQLGFIPW